MNIDDFFIISFNKTFGKDGKKACKNDKINLLFFEKSYEILFEFLSPWDIHTFNACIFCSLECIGTFLIGNNQGYGAAFYDAALLGIYESLQIGAAAADKNSNLLFYLNCTPLPLTISPII